MLSFQRRLESRALWICITPILLQAKEIEQYLNNWIPAFAGMTVKYAATLLPDQFMNLHKLATPQLLSIFEVVLSTRPG